MLHEITDLTLLRKFILGGKATIVLENQKTMNHLSYYIKLKYEVKSPYSYTYYVYCNKQYIGALVEFEFEGNKLISFNPKLVLDDDIVNKYNKVFEGFIKLTMRRDRFPNDAKVYHTGRCSKCNRELNDPESIRIGMGTVCREN